MAGLAAIASLAGGFIQAAGTMSAAKAQQASLKYQNQQLEVKQKNQRAAGYLEAREATRRRDLALSTLQARSAASGFSATDATTMQLGEQITKRAQLQSDIQKFKGLDAAAGTQAQIEGNKITSQSIGTGAGFSALGQVLGGVTGFAKYSSQMENPFFGGGSGSTAAAGMYF